MFEINELHVIYVRATRNLPGAARFGAVVDFPTRASIGFAHD